MSGSIGGHGVDTRQSPQQLRQSSGGARAACTLQQSKLSSGGARAACSVLEGLKQKLLNGPSWPAKGSQPRRIHIYFSDTGGGHRASAMAIQAALEQQSKPKVSVELVDFIRVATPWPWSSAPEGYQILGHFPTLWKRMWEHAQTSETWRDTSTFAMIWTFCREKVLSFLLEVGASGVDLIISVHPLVHHLVLEGLQWIATVDRTRVQPILQVITVVTDLGSAHLSWFDPRVDMLFVPSREIQDLAVKYGVPQGKIFLCGLPVREGFWRSGRPTVEAMKDMQIRLGLRPTERPEIVLLMGGGEGFGKIADVAISIGHRLAHLGFGQLVVICGRNEQVKKKLTGHVWPNKGEGEVFRPQILGFVANIEDYMTAADCLVTKAGPGSIAEAMTKGLPCLLTSFVPGQEEGNVKYITENDAGAFVQDDHPEQVADKLAVWLSDPELMLSMAQKAQGLARPRAALDIAQMVFEHIFTQGSTQDSESISCSESRASQTKPATTPALKKHGYQSNEQLASQSLGLSPPTSHKEHNASDRTVSVTSASLIDQLTELGFEPQDAAQAARRCSSVEAAVDWLTGCRSDVK